MILKRNLKEHIPICNFKHFWGGHTLTFHSEAFPYPRLICKCSLIYTFLSTILLHCSKYFCFVCQDPKKEGFLPELFLWCPSEVENLGSLCHSLHQELSQTSFSQLNTYGTGTHLTEGNEGLEKFTIFSSMCLLEVGVLGGVPVRVHSLRLSLLLC